MVKDLMDTILKIFSGNLLQVKTNPMKCNLCGNEFFGEGNMADKLLRDHIKTVHSSQRLKEFGLPPSKQKEIDEAKTVVAEVTTTSQGQVVEYPTTPVSKAPPPEPIVLEYKYKGQCDVCGVRVDTLKVEIDGMPVMVAYCGNCRKQKSQQKVIPIDEQYEKPKDDSKKAGKH